MPRIKKSMKVEYDPHSDTLTIPLREARIRESDEVRRGVIVDFGEDGAVVRFEILGASKVVDRTRDAKEMALERVAAIDLATAAALGSALPLEKHWDDPRWRALAEKHLR
jgi:uncharacterized protein YuzE